MQIDVYSNKGIKGSKVTLDSDVFGAKVNKNLLQQAVYIYNSNQRQNNAHAKTRAEVSGGGKKPWRQKGTGRARAGSSRSPIWKGGGVTFGPRNNKNFSKALSKKMKKQAIKAALSMKANDKMITVFDGFDLGKEKWTQNLSKLLKKAGVEGKTLIIQADNNSEIRKAANSLTGVTVSMANEINVFNVLNNSSIVILKPVLEIFTQYWGIKKEAPAAKKEVKATKKTTTKSTARKATVKKTATKKTPAKKTTVKKTATRKPVAKKTVKKSTK